MNAAQWVQRALDAARQQTGSVAVTDAATLDAIADMLVGDTETTKKSTPTTT